MISYSPTIPLNLDPRLGYSMNMSLANVAKQNFKMLMLTAPGERIMIPDFGVGLRNFLFDQKGPLLENQLKEKINQQVSTYMPSISIEHISFEGSETDRNTLNISIFYSIPSIGLSDVLNVSSTSI